MSKQKQGKVVMDLDAIMDFVFAPTEKRNTDVELEETFLPIEEDGEPSNTMMLAQRVRHESKSGERTQHEAIRVTMISRLLDSVEDLDTNAEDMSFGQEIAYNTLFNYGFLKEI